MYQAQMRLNILLGIFVSICIFCVHCISDSENDENLNAANKAIVKSTCEKSKLQIACPKGQVINIVQANYGRVNNLAKCNPNKNKKFNTKCKSSKSLTVMRQRCHLKPGCSVDATNSVFGDPCPKTIKYLEIQYRCVTQKVTTKITNIKRTTPKATTRKKVATTKIPPKKVTPQPVTTSKPKKPTPRVSTETTANLTTVKPTPRVSTETTAKLTTVKPTTRVTTETTAKFSTVKLTPKVSTETTEKLTTEKRITKVSTFEDTTFREITTVENKPLTKHACEQDTLHVECEVGKVIRVLQANYGRTSREICPENNAEHWNIKCVYPKTEEIMRNMCDGKKNCTVAAKNSVFTDPCGYTRKYLEVKYLCEDEITTKPPTYTNLDVESSETITEIPITTQELPPSSTLKPLTEALTTTSTETPLTASEMLVTTKRFPVTLSKDDSTTIGKTTTDNPTSSISPTLKSTTSTYEATSPVPLTTKEIPILSTPKPPVTAPETSCNEEDLDCIIDDLGKRPDWFICEKDIGSYPHPASKMLFIFCLNWKPSVKKCGQGRVFSEKFLTCVNP